MHYPVAGEGEKERKEDRDIEGKGGNQFLFFLPLYFMCFIYIFSIYFYILYFKDHKIDPFKSVIE